MCKTLPKLDEPLPVILENRCRHCFASLFICKSEIGNNEVFSRSECRQAKLVRRFDVVISRKICVRLSHKFPMFLLGIFEHLY
ncbi:hypothetical protein Y032_0005g2303 [Ancylostoma ceylanicum]|uniref:Uncharacterized protein n=1 Tax=Ancylostoma ceylanicum TaxID=53326 RepID=A0A016VR98_9BILA|nr:hypothetical protein Y032_0005g2303 [Ancylostoma ceylanicum]